MTNYDIYVFLLCMIVFVLLTASSAICIYLIAKLSLRLIDNGVEDENILAEYEKNKIKKPKSKYTKIIDYAVSGMVCLLFVVMLIGSLVIRFTENSCCEVLPTYRVVKSSSMAQKNEKNTYLLHSGLNDQIQMFDLIRTEKLPDEKDLELYDIVVYETDGMLIIHRIVEIEEPNDAHPDCRLFRLQGDAVDSPDRFPVVYKQMKAIYRGDRTPFIGSFILFMQSPAGWLCTLLIVIAMISAPILDKKLQKARKQRLLLYLDEEDFADAEPKEDFADAEPEEEFVAAGGGRDV